MNLLKCPKCGELFSDSYRTCPFCAEDEEFFGGKKPKNSTRRVEKTKSPSILGPALALVALLVVGLLIYTLWGSSLFHKEESDPAPSAQQTETVTEPLSLNVSELTMELDEVDRLLLTGADSATWQSSDESVVSVDQEGYITAKSAGTATITATADTRSVTCTVTVNSKASQQKTEPEKSTESSADLAIATIYGSLEKNTYGKWDFSASVGDSFGLKVTGTDSDVSWSSSDENVATVSAGGTFEAVGSGSAVITATVDGQTLKCDVRIS